MVVILAALALLPASLPAIIPAPESYKPLPSGFDIQERTTIVASGKARIVADRLREQLRPATGFDLLIDHRPKPRSIELRIDEQEASLGEEGYRLSSSPAGVMIIAAKAAGLYYGTQTLRQLLPVTAFDKKAKLGEGWTVPGCEIVDRPRFGWRGMHLDVSRHFFPVKFIKEFIDWLAVHKMNVFHWHLTDDGGWRIEIKKYPKLTEIGAWREEQGVEWNYQGLKFPGKNSGKKVYGGFYTQAEIKDVVKYASDRFVTIVPEIEMPGHSTEAVASYPELLTCQTPVEAMQKFLAGSKADHPMMVCAGREEATEFFKNVLTEVLQLFPSKFIHLGGDEVPKDLWAECSACKARMAKEGLKDTHELQSSFIKRFDTWLAEKGRRLIGWDEILEGGLAPGAAVMSWRGISGGIAAAKAGQDVVMSPTSHCYFDFSYATTPTKTVYGYEPIPGELSETEGRKVLGAQANIWTEWLSTEEEVEMMMFPRAAALAEAVWTKFERRDWASFSDRMMTHYGRLDRLGIAYYVEAPVPKSEVVLLGNSQPIEFERVAMPEAVIRFTIDGSDPTPKSTSYGGPIRLNRAGSVRAAIFRPNGTRSDIVNVAAVSIKPDLSPKILGVNRKVLSGTFTKCPEIAAFTSLPAKNLAEVGLGEFTEKENFALHFEGFLRIPADGEYTFNLGSDDGSRMWLGETLVIDNDGLHGYVEKRLRIRLPKGDYPFRVVMFEAGGAEALRLFVESPGVTKQLVPQNWFWAKS